MKRLLIASLALALSACAGMTPAPISAPPSTGSVIAKADTVILTGERAFAAAELAYITAADGVGRLADAGVIRGDLAAQVRSWSLSARTILISGKATTDAAVKARGAVALLGIADRLNAILGSK